MGDFWTISGCFEGLPAKCIINLYHVMIRIVLDYNFEVWGRLA